MFEDIISDDPFDNPGAEGKREPYVLDCTSHKITVDFETKSVKIEGDYDPWELYRDFQEADDVLEVDSPFIEINYDGTAKLKDGWTFLPN